MKIGLRKTKGIDNKMLSLTEEKKKRFKKKRKRYYKTKTRKFRNEFVRCFVRN